MSYSGGKGLMVPFPGTGEDASVTGGNRNKIDNGRQQLVVSYSQYHKTKQQVWFKHHNELKALRSPTCQILLKQRSS
ncbi:hypothetical protein O3M35_008677 [Rhynocoris fuscipes]|uniref:Uncharacterized protein n=1 Tax=Rhynocoris fuscipes TaxID=488301 RepID=A0AAW1D9H1_9HEMI